MEIYQSRSGKDKFFICLNYFLDLINVLQDTTSQWRVLDLTINLRGKNLQAGID